MTDDWQWFRAGEGGRDRILRDEIGGLQAQLSSASARTHRLSSQLATLSGSIESRLNALSRAFDAYVELGDVRQQLAAFDEPAAVRREVMAAVEAIASGRPAAPADARDLDYWLPYAMNAVSALIEGRDATDDLQRARALGPQTDEFVVAATGALGHGQQAADLLAGVLTADESLTARQQTIWRAVATGVYGSALPAALAAAWRPQLDREPARSWSAWVAAHGSTPSSGVDWLRALVMEPEQLSAPTQQRAPRNPRLGSSPLAGRSADSEGTSTTTDSPVGGLRSVVTELIQRGMPAEEELLRRARELRALIEQPTTARSNRGAETTSPTVVSEVRHALLEPTTDPAVRLTLLRWTAPRLLTVVDELVATAAGAPPSQETLRGHGGTLIVTPAGADQAALEAARQRLTAAYLVPNAPLIAWSVSTGVAALLTLVLAVLGSGWAWMFAIALVAGVIGTARELAARRRTRRTGAAALADLQRDVVDTHARLDDMERRRMALLVELDGDAEELRRSLTSTAAAGPRADEVVSPARDR